MKTRIALGLLIGAVLGLTALNIYESHIIAAQRHLLVEMFYFLQQSCPIR